MPLKSRGKYYSMLARNNISRTAYLCSNVSFVGLDLAHLALSSSAKMFKTWLVFFTASLALPNQVASVCKIKVVPRRTSERRVTNRIFEMRASEGGQTFLIRVSFIDQYYYYNY